MSNNMEYNNLNRNLVGVLFPGVVKNDEKALQCLGGIRQISQVYSQPTKKRLGLSYQPENPYVKKIFADNKKTAGVLLRVKVKKVKVANEVKKEVVSTTVLGRVLNMYTFESMCDFQYLPVERDGADSEPKCILEQILPSGTDNYNFMMEAAPLFLVPANFTRFDKPINYSYMDKRYTEKREISPDRDEDVHHRMRTDRGLPATRFKFSLVDDLPTEPDECFVKMKKEKMSVYPNLQQEYDTVNKILEERPICSLNMIKFQTKIRLSSLRIILPCLAFYIKDGPWRMLWVRYGYDPRKDPKARMYQTLDFRIRHTAGIHSMVMTRDQTVHYKKADRVRHLKGSKPEESTNNENILEGAVFFRPGMAPSQRQIFYQYCDIEIPEVQELLAPEPSPGQLCHLKRGWLGPDMAEVCRDHMFKYAKDTLLASHNADLKLEGSDDEDSSNSDNGTTSGTGNEPDETLNNK